MQHLVCRSLYRHWYHHHQPIRLQAAALFSFIQPTRQTAAGSHIHTVHRCLCTPDNSSGLCVPPGGQLAGKLLLLFTLPTAAAPAIAVLVS